jgi:RimJ/RimL family protein N-acetyltransferase
MTAAETVALSLRSFDTAMLTAIAADAEAWARREQVSLGEHGPLLETVAAGTIRFMAATGAAAPWAGHLAVDEGRRLVVGVCSFKGPPDVAGTVEVAYFTFPSHEGRGYATAMARQLRDFAATEGSVRTVRAHTLPERNASGRILTKLGFRNVGEVLDPEDGPVWRWDWPVPSA